MERVGAGSELTQLGQITPCW